jgi:hypothetical protein
MSQAMSACKSAIGADANQSHTLKVAGSNPAPATSSEVVSGLSIAA